MEYHLPVESVYELDYRDVFDRYKHIQTKWESSEVYAMMQMLMNVRKPPVKRAMTLAEMDAMEGNYDRNC